MGPSFELTLPWWAAILLFLYLFVICFGIGAVLGFVANYVWISVTVEPEEKEDSRFMRIFVSVLCGLLGGFMNYGIVVTFS